MAIGGIPPGGSGASGAPPTLADALAGLKTGDVVTARVQQAVANTARLAIGRAVIDVLTQVALKPGTTVALQVQRSDSGVTLQVVQPEAGQAQQTTAQTARPLPGSHTAAYRFRKAVKAPHNHQPRKQRNLHRRKHLPARHSIQRRARPSPHQARPASSPPSCRRRKRARPPKPFQPVRHKHRQAPPIRRAPPSRAFRHKLHPR
ncbi:MAG: hypothetical protein R3D43_07865 [Tepidamorphaceae bacterium]